jgi:hypothetical protein
MSNNKLVDFITPDEKMTWTIKQIASEIPEFEFLGPGWYNKDKSWMVFIPTLIKDVYDIQLWYDRDPRLGFVAFADAPVRSHTVVPPVKTKTPPIGGLLILAIGMLVLLPLSIFVTHKFGFYWGVGIMMVVGLLVGRMARHLDKGKLPNRQK